MNQNIPQMDSSIHTIAIELRQERHVYDCALENGDD